MLEAYVLAGELARASGDHAAAFAAYERRLRDFIAEKQKSAAAYASAFAPRTAFGVWFRNQVTRLFGIPAVADWFIARDLKDEIEIPDYQHVGATLH
jgi:2-polyprenyl-6-methoxyphenol hydroxylase-like FAD-dependent oxidoreductase